MRPRSVRGRLLVAVLGAVVLALVAATAGFNLLLDTSLSREADHVVRARAAAELSSLQIRHGKLSIGEAPDAAAGDAPIWVFGGGKSLERPARSGAAVDAAARAAAALAPGFLNAPGELRLYASPVVIGGRRLGAVVAGVSLAPYARTRHTALIQSLALAGVLLVAFAFAARWLLRAALRPVARMTEQAADWSESDPGRRFLPGEPYDELTRLAATLDRLLDRLAASLRREQRFSAEISHELRTPLAKLTAEAELALRRERTPGEYRATLETVVRNANGVARIVDALVAAARQETSTARGTADAAAPAEVAVDACERLAEEHGVELRIETNGAPMRVGVDGELAARVLQPLVENACRYARGEVTITLARRGASVVYLVTDDGPGVPEADRNRVFEPGTRGEDAGSNGAGLGLALARRLARSASGDVQAVDGGFEARLPAA